MSDGRYEDEFRNQRNPMSETSPLSNGWPAGVATITLIVDDLEESRGFYQRVFGLPVVF